MSSLEIAGIIVVLIVIVAVIWYYLRVAPKFTAGVRGISWDPSAKQLRLLVTTPEKFTPGDRIVLSRARVDGRTLTVLEGREGEINGSGKGLLCPRGTSGNIVTVAFKTPPYSPHQWCRTDATAVVSVMRS